MAFLSDPFSLLIFAGAILLAFLLGRLGRKFFYWLRRNRTPAAAGPPPSRQVRRAQRRKFEKKIRD